MKTTNSTFKQSTPSKNHSHMKWSWVLMIIFFSLGILDFRFGILGFACMGAPIYHVLRGRGNVHCKKYCPRGSLLGKFLDKISLQNQMPKFMLTKKFKNALLALMIIMFSISMFHAGLNFSNIAFAMFRFMTMSLIVGLTMGVFFKSRSWCAVCPMGHGTRIIDKHLKSNSKSA